MVLYSPAHFVHLRVFVYLAGQLSTNGSIAWPKELKKHCLAVANLGAPNRVRVELNFLFLPAKDEDSTFPGSHSRA